MITAPALSQKADSAARIDAACVLRSLLAAKRLLKGVEAHTTS